ncbi:MAG: AraC family transcriptional regulator [Rhodospirillales bacterium]|nr:AraC family transcriptional regulator [Rhodospirillales bacterium]
MMAPRITERAAFTVGGIDLRTTNAAEMDLKTARIPALWERFSIESLPGHIPGQTNPGTVLGLYSAFDSDADGPYTLMVGCEISPESRMPVGLVATTVPPAKYVVFTSEKGEIPSIIFQAWQEIWAMTPEQLGGARAYTGDFEVYDDRAADLNDAQIDIWISIKG